MEQLVCTHCGHHFESESAETPVCPKCFWSTSVRKEETVSQGQAPTDQPAEMRGEGSSHRFWIGGATLGVFLVATAIFVARHLQKQEKVLQTIQAKNEEVIATQAPELRLLPEEREILSRKVVLSPDRSLMDSEKEILARRVLLRPPSVRGLPGSPWDEKQFKEFLEAQEHQHQIPLGWSYGRELAALFMKHYPRAVEAFEKKDFLTARDEWIRSLTFPIYQNDEKKHRGVVLTMLRPYINDILSKIGAMNAMLTQKGLYATEEKIRAAYENLHKFLEEQAWEEANAKILELREELGRVGSPLAAASPPPFPKELALIDRDIQEVLLAQAAPIRGSVPDWEAVQGDLRAKEKVVQSRVPGTWEFVRGKYEEALRLIENRNWAEAIQELQEIQFPEELVQDARAKLEVLGKLTKTPSSRKGESASLDSESKSG